MTFAPRHRWMLLAALLTLTLSAAAWVSDSHDPEEVVDASPRPVRATTMAILPKEAPAIHLRKLDARSTSNRTDDVFPPHTWRKPTPATPPPAPAPAPAPVVAAKAVVTTPPPQQAAPPPPPPAAPPPARAPPLPFTYLGHIESEETNGVFLVFGDRSLIVRAGEVIDSLYRVDTVSDAGLTFTHLPTGIQQTLAVGPPR